MAEENGLNAPNRSVDDVLQESDLGQFLSKYKLPLGGALLLILIAAVGQGLYFSKQEEKRLESSQALYEFEEAHLNKWLKGPKLEDWSAVSNALKAKLEVLSSNALTSSALIPAIDSLINLEAYAEALEVSEILYKSFPPSKWPTLASPLAYRYAGLLEAQNKNQEAVDVLKALMSSSVKLIEGKAYLDLGRLYKKLGNTAEAKKSFQYVIDNFKENNFDRLARLHLEKL